MKLHGIFGEIERSGDDLVGNAIAQMGKNLALNRKLVRQLLVPGWVCSNEKARRVLGYAPRRTVRESGGEKHRDRMQVRANDFCEPGQEMGMSEEQGMMSKLGDAVEAAKEKAQAVGATVAKKAESIASEARKEMAKAKVAVEKKARKAKTSVERTAKTAQAASPDSRLRSST